MTATYSADPITRVKAVTARFQLPRPLRLGALDMTHREYVFAEITTKDGHVGKAYALSRDLPVAEIVGSVLARVLVGHDSGEIAARWNDCYRATLPAGRVGLVMRAISLIDIALWDIQAQRAQLPLWRLLGGLQPDLPVSIVSGYLSQDTTPESVADMVLEHASVGYRYLKVARSNDPALTSRLLALVHDQLPASSQVVVDGLWVWRTVREAVEEISSWTEYGRLAWIEDPFPPEEIELCAELRKRCPVPLGLGDELTDRRVFQALLAAEAIDVVRVDATAIGGISGAVRVMHLAAANGRDVAPHFYPEVHVHCVAGLPGCLAVEMFDPAGSDLEFSHRFVIGGPDVRGGRAHVPETAGLGFELDWELIDQVRRGA